jgi:hypothetical protein
MSGLLRQSLECAVPPVASPVSLATLAGPDKATRV